MSEPAWDLPKLSLVPPSEGYGMLAPPTLDVPLQHGGGGGTSGGMDAIDAKISASEARTDTKFAELRGDLKDFASKGDLYRAVWGAAAAVIATFIGLMAFGGDRFDAGLGQADVRQAQLERDARQDDTAKAINSKLDTLIKQTAPTPANKPD